MYAFMLLLMGIWVAFSLRSLCCSEHSFTFLLANAHMHFPDVLNENFHIQQKKKKNYTEHPSTQQLNVTISMLLYLVLVTHLEPDMLECKVKGPLGSIAKSKTSGDDGISAELFKTQMMMLFECYTQYISKVGKLSSGHRTGKGQFSF